MVGTEPDHYRTQFLSRCQGLRAEGGGGALKEAIRWEVGHEGIVLRRVRLAKGKVEGIGSVGSELKVAFGWREMVAVFYHLADEWEYAIKV